MSKLHTMPLCTLHKRMRTMEPQMLPRRLPTILTLAKWRKWAALMAACGQQQAQRLIQSC